MSRLAMVAPHNEPAELKPVFDQLRATRGRVPAMYRTLAHQPAVLAAHRAYFHAALDAGVLPRPFKEKIAFKVARLRETPEELEAIARGDYATLPAGERAALRFAEAMVAERGCVSDTTFMALTAHFADSEIVEMVALIGIMELACSLAQVFELEPD
jgi:alkylhydroperoxidase family enzyme